MVNLSDLQNQQPATRTEAMDHESPQTTAIYAHVVDEELQAAIENRI